jgi:multiple sugar transport system ATP-binding protein
VAEIVFDNVTKVFDDGTVAVSDLNLRVDDGSLMVLVGPSGCGKTTSLRMVAGLERITDGELRIGDRVVNEVAPKDRDIAMVFQNYALYPHMTVFQNMAFGLQLRHMPKPVVNGRVEDTAKFLELFDLLRRKPGQLSGGQRQRVAMGRAIVREPKAFLMDEPLSNLDAKLRVQMRSEISRLQRDLAVTTVFVTHDQIEAMTMGDTVAVLRLGVLQQVASPQALYRRPANLFVAGFIGSPAMNMVDATIRSDDQDALQVAFGEHTVTIDPALVAERPALRGYVDRPVILGVRPGDLEDAALHPDSPPGRRIKTTVDLREDMGSEILVHFTIDVPPVQTDDLKELALEQGETEESLESEQPKHTTFIASFDADSTAAEGDRVEVLVDTRVLHFFDPETRDSIWHEAP